jgi:hypothetical protein
MPCDTRLKPRQTISERAKEIREAGKKIDELLTKGKVDVVIGEDGAVAFNKIPDDVRDGMTDACIYRAIMSRGGFAAKQAIVKAEQRSGRSINKQTVAQGVHSHDGGRTWHGRG